MDFQVWYNELPFVTKHYMTAAFITTAVVSFKLIHYSYLALIFYEIYHGFEVASTKIWRLVTNFFVFGKFSFDFLFRMILLYFGLSKLEKLYQPNKYAELFWLIIANSFFLIIMGIVFNEFYLSYSLSFCFLYIWCKRVPFERVQFLFGFLVTSAYLPWVLIGYTLITGGSVTSELIGLASGHLYIVLKDIVPNSHGYNILKTPQFFEKLVNNHFYRRAFAAPAGGNNAAGGAAAAGGFANFGGAGVRIG